MFKYFLIFLFLINFNVKANDIFLDGFESGNGSAWHATKGNVNYPNQDCKSGKFCGSMTMQAGVPQQSVFWERNFRTDKVDYFMSAWFKFPKDYSWNPAPGANSTEHKLFIVNVGNDIGRILLNLRGGGTTPTIQIHFERLESFGGVSQYTETRWPNDGQWHKLSLYVERKSGRDSKVITSLDENEILNVKGATCGAPCSPVVGVQIGAFVNQGSTRVQTFYVDDVIIRDSSPTIIPAPAPTPLPPIVVCPSNAEVIEKLNGAIKLLEESKATLERN